MSPSTYGPGYAPRAFREGYCKESVHEQGRGVSFYQCQRKAVRDGYCAQHHPDAVKARRAARDKRYEEQQDKSPYRLLSQAREELAREKTAYQKLHRACLYEQHRAEKAEWERRGLRREVADLREQRDRLEWMLGEFIENGHAYRKARAGFAEFFTLIRKDLEDAYESQPSEEDPELFTCDDCGKEAPIADSTTLNAYDGAGELEQVHLCPECATKNEERGLE